MWLHRALGAGSRDPALPHLLKSALQSANATKVILLGHRDPILSAAFSPDGRRVVTASMDQTARVWEAETGRLVATLKGHKSRVDSAAFSPKRYGSVDQIRDKEIVSDSQRISVLVMTRAFPTIGAIPLQAKELDAEEVAMRQERFPFSNLDKVLILWAGNTPLPAAVSIAHTALGLLLIVLGLLWASGSYRGVATQSFCQLCGTAAAVKNVVFYKNVGAIWVRFSNQAEGALCKNCIHRHFWTFTPPRWCWAGGAFFLRSSRPLRSYSGNDQPVGLLPLSLCSVANLSASCPQPSPIPALPTSEIPSNLTRGKVTTAPSRRSGKLGVGGA